MSPIYTWDYKNHGFWFDRDGVDVWQATYWNYKDGFTYNTQGVYNVVIQYSAIAADTGVMYATINGEQQGFYIPVYSSINPPSMMPVGRTFTGDMTKMQVFYGRGGGGGTVTISDINVEGCGYLPVNIDIKPQSCPNPLNVKSKGVLPVAILGTEDFDVTQIDPASIRLEGVPPLRWALEDVAEPEGELEECTTAGPDGYLDLTLKFDVQEIVAALGGVSNGNVLVLTLTGSLLEEFNGTPIEGEDVIIIIKR